MKYYEIFLFSNIHVFIFVLYLHMLTYLFQEAICELTLINYIHSLFEHLKSSVIKRIYFMTTVVPQTRYCVLQMMGTRPLSIYNGEILYRYNFLYAEPPNIYTRDVPPGIQKSLKTDTKFDRSSNLLRSNGSLPARGMPR